MQNPFWVFWDNKSPESSQSLTQWLLISYKPVLPEAKSALVNTEVKKQQRGHATNNKCSHIKHLLINQQ